MGVMGCFLGTFSSFQVNINDLLLFSFSVIVAGNL